MNAKKKKGETAKKSGRKIEIAEEVKAEAPAESEAAEDSEEAETELSELETLRLKLEEKGKLAEEAEDRLLRLGAEFDNYKKRMEKEKADHIKYGNERFAKELLPALDSLERAVAHAADDTDAKVIVDGITLIFNQLKKCLESFEIRHIKAVGEKFDPNLHEAVSQVESEDHDEGVVMAEVQKGYMIRDRLLRPSCVVVSRGSSGEKPETSGEAAEQGDQD